MKITMPETLRHLTIEAYLDSLASREPTPGGGAVVALMGAQAAALLSMSMRITAKTDDAEQLGRALDARRQKLLDLADADASAFASVMQAYKLPASDDDAKLRRVQAIQDAFKVATQVPVQVMTEIAALYDDGDAVAQVVKPNVASDVGVAAQLIHAAIKSCRYNLWINLNYIQDKQFKVEVHQQAKLLLDSSKNRRDQIHRQIKALLKN